MGIDNEPLLSNPQKLGPTSGSQAVKFKLLLAFKTGVNGVKLDKSVEMFAWRSNVLANVPVRARAAFGVVPGTRGKAWTAQSLLVVQEAGRCVGRLLRASFGVEGSNMRR